MHLFIRLINQSINSTNQSINQSINQAISHSFNWLNNPKMLPALSLSFSKSDRPWILSRTWQRIYALSSSEERFCVRSLQVTRYTDPGDIWKKLKLRGEDTGSVTPSISSDGKPEEESRLNVSIPHFFSVPHPFPRHVRSISSYLHFILRPKYNCFVINHYYYHW